MPLPATSDLVNKKSVLYGTAMRRDHEEPASRRELRRRDRRENILKVAAGSFLKGGYASTTMSAIAAALGGSKGTLWSYFSSKEELFAAVIDHASAAYRARLSEILEAPCDDVAATLRRVCSSIVTKVTSTEAVALQRLVMAETARFGEMGRIFYDRAPQKTYELLAQFLRGAIDRGQLRREDEPIDMARMLVSLCLAGTQQRLLAGILERATPAQITADVERAVKVFTRAYAPMPEPA